MIDHAVSPDIGEGARLLRSRMQTGPEAVIVLGSGLGGLADRLEDPVEVPFAELPGFPSAGVAGHAGRYVGGRLAGRLVLVQAGRYHLYEGRPEAVVGGPARLAAALGVRHLLLTNAAGGIDPLLAPGDLVLVSDHVDLTARHLLSGTTSGGDGRGLELDPPYDRDLQRSALDAARRLDIPLRRGVYAAVHGPSYETAAEVRMLRRMGADVVGMSTVPEVLVARALGLRCLALSVVTNVAGAAAGPRVDHADVVDVAGLAAARVERILAGVVEDLPQSGEAK